MHLPRGALTNSPQVLPALVAAAWNAAEHGDPRGIRVWGGTASASTATVAPADGMDAQLKPGYLVELEAWAYEDA